ncbi:MAG TPA: sulfotransferase [Rhizomicrobium sp.]|nr:sulfotransferase [Rhizomicrobium sp.]
MSETGQLLRQQLRQAEELLRRGQFGAAVQVCRNLSSADRKQPAALQILGAALAQNGELDEAEAVFRRLVENNPRNASLNLSLGNVVLLKGDAAAAERSYRAALAESPNQPEIHFNLARALKAQDRLFEALAALNKAVELKPSYAEALAQSGVVLMAMNNLKPAVEAFTRALGLRESLFEAHYNLGLAYERLDRLNEAKLSLARAASLNDRSSDAFFALGRTLHRLQQRELATSALARSAALKPDNADAHGLLALVFLEDGWTMAALDEIGKAIALDPDKAEFHITHGRVLAELNRLEEAEAANRRAVELAPQSMQALGALGRSYLSVGRMDEARGIFQRQLALHMDDIHPHLDMARVEKFKPGDPRLTQLESFLPLEDTMNATDRSALHFTLGRAYDELGDFDRAFGHFTAANLAQRQGMPDTEAEDRLWFERTMQVYDSGLFARNRGSGSSSRVPIFVLGMPRSGTTLIEQIISSHPQVRGAGEVQDLENATRILINRHKFVRPMPELAQDLKPEHFRELGEAYVERLSRRAPGAARITDKLLGNYNRIGLIQLALPNAVIVHCRRNPLDNCVSIYTNHFAERLEHANDLARLGRYYGRYHALMEHWRLVLPGRFLGVQYEDTVSDLETAARRVIAWCGLDWDARCLDFQKNARRVATLSITQVRQPVYKSSVARWRNYEKHLEPLRQALGALAGP